MSVLAERARRCSNHALRHALVIDARDVVDAHPTRAFGDIEVLAPQLDAACRPGAVLRCPLETLPIAPMPGVPVRVGILVQIAADHGLRLVPFGHLDGTHRSLAPYVSVEAYEVDEVGTQPEQLRHDGIVIVLLGQV